jgi:hypothetical protein
MKNIVANWTAPTLDKAHDLDMPEGLSDKGQEAHEIIVAFLREHELTHTGGCTAFYAPADWRKRGEEYGHKGELVVVYDGGDLRPVFSMDAAYDLDCMIYQETGKPSTTPYSLYEGMTAKLRAAGLYFEECTSWYCAIYCA